MLRCFCVVDKMISYRSHWMRVRCFHINLLLLVHHNKLQPNSIKIKNSMVKPNALHFEATLRLVEIVVRFDANWHTLTTDVHGLHCSTCKFFIIDCGFGFVFMRFRFWISLLYLRHTLLLVVLYSTSTCTYISCWLNLWCVTHVTAVGKGDISTFALFRTSVIKNRIRGEW